MSELSMCGSCKSSSFIKFWTCHLCVEKLEAQIASLQEAIKIATRFDEVALSANKKLDDASAARIKKLEEALRKILQLRCTWDHPKHSACGEGIAEAALEDK